MRLAYAPLAAPVVPTAVAHLADHAACGERLNSVSPFLC